MVKKIKIYTTPICLECERAKRFFKEKEIKYEEIDIFEKKEEAKEIFKKTGKKKVPIISIGENLFSGFDRKKIEECLEK